MILSNELDRKIIEYYQLHVDIKLICNLFDISECELRTILKENQIDRTYNQFSQELIDRVCTLYQNGFTQKKICETLLVSYSGIKKILKRNNIPLRSYSQSNQHYKRDSHYFDCIDTPNKAYILGLLCADGNNHVDRNMITLSLQESDLIILERIKEELQYEGPIKLLPLQEKNPKYKNAYVLRLSDEHMSHRLKELGMINAKSLFFQFPQDIPPYLIPHFIRGYFDGDGCIYYDNKRNKCQTQTVGTWEFCSHMSALLLDIGCKNSIKHPKQCQSRNTYILQTAGNKSSFMFLNWLYQDADLKIPRKYQQYISFREKYAKQ